MQEVAEECHTGLCKGCVIILPLRSFFFFVFFNTFSDHRYVSMVLLFPLPPRLTVIRCSIIRYLQFISGYFFLSFFFRKMHTVGPILATITDLFKTLKTVTISHLQLLLDLAAWFFLCWCFAHTQQSYF